MNSEGHIRFIDAIMLCLLATVFALSSWHAVTTDTVPVQNNSSVATVVADDASNILPIAEDTQHIPLSDLPDFTVYTSVQEKKASFFSYMLPMIRHANDRIRSDRKLLLSIRADLEAEQPVSKQKISRVANIARYYRVAADENLINTIDKLLVRVDVVPESMVLAQAANESGWGTSRFARQANNLFGVWCFSKGCGLKPLQREEGLTHEVASYPSVQDSVDAYVRTINTNVAYTELREIRVASRSDAQQFSGYELAEGLLRYSERGLDYVREIQQMIRVNNLQQYTLPIAV